MAYLGTLIKQITIIYYIYIYSSYSNKDISNRAINYFFTECILNTESLACIDGIDNIGHHVLDGVDTIGRHVLDRKYEVKR